MASALPSVSDCCSMCSGLSVTVEEDADVPRQVYTGSGDPNTGGLVPDDGTIANVYYNVLTPGEIWYWSIVNQNWF